jgi:hypothetical protein
MKTILSSKRHHYMARVSILLVTLAIIAGMVGCVPPSPGPSPEIWNWHDLDAIRDNLDGNYVLMNNLDSTTDGYDELARPTANQGKGWQPIGTLNTTFIGTLDGQGYEIRDLFINRPDEIFVGLFGIVDEGGRIEDIGVVNADVTGEVVGGLVGRNGGTVSNSYSSGNVSGEEGAGGLVGFNNNDGTVSNSYSTGYVTGSAFVGGLVGLNNGTVSNCHATGTVTGNDWVGGLVGAVGAGGVGEGTVSNCYATGTVSGYGGVGGLVGGIEAGNTVSDSYSSGNVSGEEGIGGLVGINIGAVSNSYSTGNVTGGAYVGGLVGENEGEGTVNNSFWDTETSGQDSSDGGAGKTTAKMQNIATFSGAGWDIFAVANPSTRNPSYIWNIVNNVTYPFLSWQPVS